MAFGLSAGAASLLSAGIGAGASYLSSKNAAKSMTGTQQQKLDPRVDAMLFGKDGSTGLLDTYKSYLDQPQSAALQGYGKAAGDYLSNYGAGAMQQMQGAATNAMTGTGAALASIPAYAVGGKVNAPNQNNIDLSGSYQNLIGGGDTSKLMGSLQAGNALAGAQFRQNQSDLTDNLQRNILPGIRQNSVLAGQYGGSRQGVAEGLAMSDLTRQLNNSNTQFGLGATAANSSALAGAYENGQNRALAATQGLGAQQYGVAQQNSANEMAAQMQNVGNSFDASKFNASTTNAMDAQNKSAALSGAGLLGNVMNNAYNVANNADNYQINRAQQVNGLLAPYMSANGSATSTQPLYQNTAGNVLGGALMGGQLAGMFGVGTSGGTSVFNVPSSVDNMAAKISGQQVSIPSLPMWGG